MSNTTKLFADNLSDLIDERGVQIRELSKATGISLGTISNYCNDGANASISNAVKLAKYFGVSLDWLVGLEPNCKNPDAEFRGVREYVGLSENAVAWLHRTKDSLTNAMLSSLIENQTFLILLAKMSFVVRTRVKHIAKLNKIGFSWDADDIVNSVTPENALDIYDILINPPKRDEDERFQLFEMMQVFNDVLEELFRPFTREEYNAIYVKVMQMCYEHYRQNGEVDELSDTAFADEVISNEK